MFNSNVFKQTFINISTATWNELVRLHPYVVQMQQHNYKAAQIFVLLMHEWVFGY